MYDRILVCLDGSVQAELVLSYVVPLAEKFRSSVTLLRATRSMASLATMLTPSGEGTALDPTPMIEADRGEVTAYLEHIAAQLAELGLGVESVTMEGPAAEAILVFARRTQADLIALTAQGGGELERLLFGSVADEVLRHAPCPVLVVGLNETQANQAGVTRLAPS